MTNTPTDPVEAVARAMYAVNRGQDSNFSWYCEFDSVKSEYRQEARAAIRAYREALEASGWQVVPKEPTAAMFDAAHETARQLGGDAPFVQPYKSALQAAPTPEYRDDD